VFGYSARQTILKNVGCVIKPLLYINEQPLVLEFKSIVPVCNRSRKEYYITVEWPSLSAILSGWISNHWV